MPTLDPKTTHLRVSTTHGKTFRRFGTEFGPEPTLVAVDGLDDKQIAEFTRKPRTIQTARRADAVEKEVLILRVEQVVVRDDGSVVLPAAARRAPAQGKGRKGR